eukprot:CAMPEP_0201950718 /NCGR_PEP_ID=MMETSP0903-20130614/56631_1 /ASSEMBLY_ACC=CAM_ASM_000552 /TAXON_ID=420261 /ORGANISM="Thalassiosira antarctica, Strain CCMP982" /LENGTH=353 /DNA_ID=CAMNT_0048493963 /DNA_START=319 /DNA_END=1380 /DNA_ORIENTATION=+
MIHHPRLQLKEGESSTGPVPSFQLHPMQCLPKRPLLPFPFNNGIAWSSVAGKLKLLFTISSRGGNPMLGCNNSKHRRICCYYSTRRQRGNEAIAAPDVAMTQAVFASAVQHQLQLDRGRDQTQPHHRARQLQQKQDLQEVLATRLLQRQEQEDALLQQQQRQRGNEAIAAPDVAMTQAVFASVVQHQLQLDRGWDQTQPHHRARQLQQKQDLQEVLATRLLQRQEQEDALLQQQQEQEDLLLSQQKDALLQQQLINDPFTLFTHNQALSATFTTVLDSLNQAIEGPREDDYCNNCKKFRRRNNANSSSLLKILLPARLGFGTAHSFVNGTVMAFPGSSIAGFVTMPISVAASK